MSVSFDQQGFLNAPTSTALSSTNKTDVFTPTGSKAFKVAMVKAANIDTSNACKIAIYWNDGTNDHLLHHENVAANSTVDIHAPVVLGDGQKARKLVAQAENANDLTITVFAVQDAQ